MRNRTDTKQRQFVGLIVRGREHGFEKSWTYLILTTHELTLVVRDIDWLVYKLTSSIYESCINGLGCVEEWIIYWIVVGD